MLRCHPAAKATPASVPLCSCSRPSIHATYSLHTTTTSRLVLRSGPGFGSRLRLMRPAIPHTIGMALSPASVIHDLCSVCQRHCKTRRVHLKSYASGNHRDRPWLRIQKTTPDTCVSPPSGLSAQLSPLFPDNHALAASSPARQLHEVLLGLLQQHLRRVPWPRRLHANVMKRHRTGDLQTPASSTQGCV